MDSRFENQKYFRRLIQMVVGVGYTILRDEQFRNKQLWVTGKCWISTIKGAISLIYRTSIADNLLPNRFVMTDLFTLTTDLISSYS